eukprot:gene3617-4503_t
MLDFLKLEGMKSTLDYLVQHQYLSMEVDVNEELLHFYKVHPDKVKILQESITLMSDLDKLKSNPEIQSNSELMASLNTVTLYDFKEVALLTAKLIKIDQPLKSSFEAAQYYPHYVPFLKILGEKRAVDYFSLGEHTRLYLGAIKYNSLLKAPVQIVAGLVRKSLAQFKTDQEMVDNIESAEILTTLFSQYPRTEYLKIIDINPQESISKALEIFKLHSEQHKLVSEGLAQVSFLLGNYLYEDHQQKEAIPYLQDSVKYFYFIYQTHDNRPQLLNAMLVLADCFSETNQHGEAYGLYTIVYESQFNGRTIKSYPHEEFPMVTKLLLCIAISHKNLGRYQLAIDTALLVIEKYPPQKANCLNHIGVCYLMWQKYKEAKEIFLELLDFIKTDPKNQDLIPFVFHSLGLSSKGLGKYNEALRYFKLAEPLFQGNSTIETQLETKKLIAEMEQLLKEQNSKLSTFTYPTWFKYSLIIGAPLFIYKKEIDREEDEDVGEENDIIGYMVKNDKQNILEESIKLMSKLDEFKSKSDPESVDLLESVSLYDFKEMALQIGKSLKFNDDLKEQTKEDQINYFLYIPHYSSFLKNVDDNRLQEYYSGELKVLARIYIGAIKYYVSYTEAPIQPIAKLVKKALSFFPTDESMLENTESIELLYILFLNFPDADLSILGEDLLENLTRAKKLYQIDCDKQKIVSEGLALSNLYLGTYHFTRKNFKEAMAYLEESVKQLYLIYGSHDDQPQLSQALVSLGDCYVELEIYQEAISVFTIFLNSNLNGRPLRSYSHSAFPMVTTVQSQIAICYKNLGRYQLSIELFTKVLESDPDSLFHCTIHISLCHMLQGNFTEAQNSLIKLLKFLKNDPTYKSNPDIESLRALVHYRLGLCYFESKDYKLALKYFKLSEPIFLAIDPNHEVKLKITETQNFISKKENNLKKQIISIYNNPWLKYSLLFTTPLIAIFSIFKYKLKN